MGRLAAVCRSMVGKKVVLAATGIVLFLFLVGHLLGNLLIFVGREQLNAYAAFLKRTGELLWAARLILLAALILHILASLQITLVNWRARPIDYVVKKDVETGYAARTMIISGPLVFLYVAYHLSCSNHGECEAVCPNGISIDFIARLNRDFVKASVGKKLEPVRTV
ncbi:MAG TPA: hypothetical protein VLM91_24590 [Candidatus Methylomirabilis sp.]|nr:hypothetical protein [Candidatus Methylomirabilis sp.]